MEVFNWYLELISYDLDVYVIQSKLYDTPDEAIEKRKKIEKEIEWANNCEIKIVKVKWLSDDEYEIVGYESEIDLR